MTTEDKHVYDLDQQLQLQLKLLARIALIVCVIAFFALLITLHILFRGQSRENYFEILLGLTYSHDQLGLAMWFGGAIIVLAAGFMTWMLLLYSSARIAGPLYRFYRNVELEIDRGPVQTIGLRRGDYLQDLSCQLNLAVENLQAHHADLDSQAAELQRILDGEETATKQQKLRDGIQVLGQTASGAQA